MNHGDLESFILHTVERLLATRYTERHALVTSYDPVNYLAKVTLQPEGQETGWLPIETGHIGQGYGIAIGLQPGQGGTGSGGQQGGSSGQSSPNQGDQVVVRPQEGDIEAFKIVQRVHSSQDKPPPVQSGEMVFWTQFQQSGGQTPDAAKGGQGGTGQKIYFKNDGSITITDGNGGTIVFDGQGNCTVNCKNYTINATQSATHNIGTSATYNIGTSRSVSVGANDNVTIGQNKTVSIGQSRSDNVSNAYLINSQVGVWSSLTDDDG